MNSQPQLFPESALGESFDLEYGAPMPERERSGFDYPVFGSNGIVGRHSKFLIAGPGIVVGRKGSVGEVSWSSESFWPIDTAFYVVPKGETDLRWLYWLLTRTDLKRLDAATGVPGLNRNDVYSLKAHRPPAPDQPRVAAVLDTVDEAIAKTEAVIAKLRQVRAGLLHDLLTRGLDAHGQLRDPIAHPEQFQDSPLGRIPKEWEVWELDDLVRIIDCKHYTPKFVKDGKAFIRPRNVKPEGLDFSDVDYVSDEDFALLTDKHVPKVGDIVFSRNATFGVACYVDKPIPFAIGQDTVVMTEKAANTQFVYFVLRSNVIEPQVMRVSTGSTFGRINLAFIRSLLLPRPGPDEQRGIAQRLIAFDSQLKTEQGGLNKLTLLKSGLMTDLLTGRVRVPSTKEDAE